MCQVREETCCLIYQRRSSSGDGGSEIAACEIKIYILAKINLSDNSSLVDGRVVSASGSRFSLSVSLSLYLSLFLYLFVFFSSPFSLSPPTFTSVSFLPRLS